MARGDWWDDHTGLCTFTWHIRDEDGHPHTLACDQLDGHPTDHFNLDTRCTHERHPLYEPPLPHYRGLFVLPISELPG